MFDVDTVLNMFNAPEDRFINRELSWLSFNKRVLEEAQNQEHPLLERVKFLSISANNLDEFLMVRVAGLKDQVQSKVEKSSDDGLTPKQQLKAIYDVIAQVQSEQQQAWRTLQIQLERESIHMVTHNDLTDRDSDWLDQFFKEHIFPVLSPILTNHRSPFPFIPNLGLAMILKMDVPKEDEYMVILLPSHVSRLINVGNDGKNYLFLEEVLVQYLDQITGKRSVLWSGFIRVTRDSDLEIEDDAEDLMSHFESAVKRRRRGKVIHMEVSQSIEADQRAFIIEALSVHSKDLVSVDGILGMVDVGQLYQCQRPDLKFTPYQERFPERINELGGDHFAAIKAKDMVVHHPYETFDVVVNFLQKAADDPDVVAIKQTLYRTSSDSAIVKALIRAAEAGKSVTVVVELKARFDEESNLRWARDLERVGAQVVFGVTHLKTHAKISLVHRNEQGQLRSYAHFGTGNYHPITARTYSDLSFFTCDPDLCDDATLVFNYLTGGAEPECRKLVISPFYMRQTLSDLIDQEINHAKKGRPAYIWAKMNSLVDSMMIDALYEASQAGVTIDLVVRGICSLRPGIAGLSDRIRVKSIVGRFLEHSRIFCFGSGYRLPSDRAKLYIASADLMSRNLDRRIELMIPIDNATVHEQIMGQILLANFHDNVQSWRMNDDGGYERLHPSESLPRFCAHDYFITNPSLSGQGKALSALESRRQKEKMYRLISNDDKA